MDGTSNTSSPDLWALYRQMLRSRLFEEQVQRLWDAGLISGEMHTGLGEEAIVAGIVAQLQEGDALALDHRGTPPMIMRGVDPVLLLREFLGHPDGLCAGMGGHMHLFSPQHLAASSGIVGASGPAAVGFALAGQQLRPGTIAVAFFGEGAVNQGMLMEAMNLAAAWALPVLFVCKDNDWAISSLSPLLTGGVLVERARGMGLLATEVDGSDVTAVWAAAQEAINRARNGSGPTFLHARCVHLEGHFLGDQLLRIVRHPVREIRQILWPLLKALIAREGTAFRDRIESLNTILSLLLRTSKGDRATQQDPLEHTRQSLSADETRLRKLEAEVGQEIDQVVALALANDPALEGSLQ